MPYPIEKKLVIAVSTSALFDMEESDSIYRVKGIDAYRKYQERMINGATRKGSCIPFHQTYLEFK